MAEQASSGVVDAIYEPIEAGLDKVGLMRGKYAPSLRFITGAGLTAAALWITEPSFMFSTDGTPKQWALTAGSNSKVETTALPWWLASLAGGFLFGFLI